ncbi:MAG TPA: putative thioesterase, partial [Ruegeria sp.]|nr:putative thioesterase [Ruegeria sp.]
MRAELSWHTTESLLYSEESSRRNQKHPMTTIDQTTTKWLTFPRPNPQAKIRLFCFSYAGGGASTFRPWMQHLAPSIELCAVQLPGRENRLREAPLTRVDPIVDTLKQMLPAYFDKPFALFGHSLGAILAFELARALRNHPEARLAHVFVSARIAPQAIDPEPPIYQLPEAQFLAKLRQLNGTPTMVFENEELLEMLMPILRADFALNETYAYRPEPPLDVPLTVFGGTEDPKVSEAELGEWSAQAGGRFALKMFPGDHFFVSSA